MTASTASEGKCGSAPRVPWPDGAPDRASFIERVRDEGIRHRRRLPWRYIDDPYAVLVSEVMLQQTQVARVERFWSSFLATFPTVDALAAASASDVVAAWQGLGYNRRALALWRAAGICAEKWGGRIPRSYDDLISLPGIGEATAAGVRAFAWGRSGVYLETNVRAVFIHVLFPDQEEVSDRTLRPLVADVCPPSAPFGDGDVAAPGEPDPLAGPRDWYYALLDWGAHLKASGVNPTRRSNRYARQSAFEGSRRQKRSRIVRLVLASDGPLAEEAALHALNEDERRAGRDAVDEEEFSSILDDLCAEGFFCRIDGNLVAS